MMGVRCLDGRSVPTSARATAQNVLFNIGRAVGGFSPMVVGMIISMYSLPSGNCLPCDYLCNRYPSNSILDS